MWSARRSHSAAGGLCPIPSISTSSAPGGRGGRATAADVAQGVVGAVDDEGRNLERGEESCAVARRDGRDGLAADGDRVVVTVVGHARDFGVNMT